VFVLKPERFRKNEHGNRIGRGLVAMERLMGMLLIAIAVQMLLEGISAYLLEHG
jgi:hypothetical protein